jgi:hypothetical protein
VAGFYRRRVCRGALLRGEAFLGHLNHRYGGRPRQACVARRTRTDQRATAVRSWPTREGAPRGRGCVMRVRCTGQRSRARLDVRVRRGAARVRIPARHVSVQPRLTKCRAYTPGTHARKEEE